MTSHMAGAGANRDFAGCIDRAGNPIYSASGINENAEHRRARVVSCWAGIAGYAAACWRALAKLHDIEAQVITFSPQGSEKANAPFDATILNGIPVHVATPEELAHPQKLANV